MLMNMNPKDLRVNPSQEAAFDEEQVTCTKVFKCCMGFRYKAPLITQGKKSVGEDPPRPILTWGLK